MNIYQKIVLFIGLLLFFIVLIFFTPYNHIQDLGPLGEIVKGTSYGSIFTLPNATDGKLFDAKPLGKYSKHLQAQGERIESQMTVDANTVEIDYLKLSSFIIIVLITSTVLFFIVKSSKVE